MRCGTSPGRLSGTPWKWARNSPTSAPIQRGDRPIVRRPAATMGACSQGPAKNSYASAAAIWPLGSRARAISETANAIVEAVVPRDLSCRWGAGLRAAQRGTCGLAARLACIHRRVPRAKNHRSGSEFSLSAPPHARTLAFGLNDMLEPTPPGQAPSSHKQTQKTQSASVRWRAGDRRSDERNTLFVSLRVTTAPGLSAIARAGTPKGVQCA